jgi:RNA polymerase-binding transcription factor DksA
LNELQIEDAERFSDESDRASNIEMINNSEALKNHRAHLERCPEDFDGCHCVDCGEEIPAVRLKNKAWRDVFCQTIFEKRQKDFNRG